MVAGRGFGQGTKRDLQDPVSGFTADTTELVVREILNLLVQDVVLAKKSKCFAKLVRAYLEPLARPGLCGNVLAA